MKKPRKRTLPCEKCPALFSKKDYLKKHVELAHSTTAEPQAPTEVMEISEGFLSLII